jgi:hypothetical protein
MPKGEEGAIGGGNGREIGSGPFLCRVRIDLKKNCSLDARGEVLSTDCAGLVVLK